ncbi:MAG: transcription factor S [Nanoarchaeota archaeon]
MANDTIFCPKCSSILVPKNVGNRVKMACSCGYEAKSRDVILKEKVNVKKIEISQKKMPLPKTKATCEKCGNKEAYYWTVQTRSSDEPETRFFECVKCGHRWREYK